MSTAFYRADPEAQYEPLVEDDLFCTRCAEHTDELARLEASQSGLRLEAEMRARRAERDLTEARARLADIAHGATVQLEGRSCLSQEWTLLEVKRVASAPL